MPRAPYHATACMGSPLMRGPWMGTLTFSSPLARSVAILMLDWIDCLVVMEEEGADESRWPIR